MARSTHHQWYSRTKLGAMLSRSVSMPPRTRACHPHRRRLRIEPLEDRRLLSITVDTLLDELDGSIIDGDVSFRDAIALAPSGEAIDFAPALTSGGPATITLTLGDLVINKNLAINGPGASLLTIDASGNDPTPDENNGDGSRVLNIDDNNANLLNVSIGGLTLTGGDGGGAIYMRDENLSLTGVTISGNYSYNGGGIYSIGGDLTVNNCTISGNLAQDGGGIFIHAGSLTVTDSSISRNAA